MTWGFLALAPPPGHAATDESCAQTGAVPYQPTLDEFKVAYAASARGQLSGYPALNPLEQGAGATPILATSPLPAILLKAIGYLESGWRQATFGVARGASGPPIISSSCAYGAMQIASGMMAPAQLDPADQFRIAGDYRFNLAWGANALIGKWNLAENEGGGNVNFRYVGDRNPCLIEDWYYAVWAYSGASFVNNPANPDYQADRPIFNVNDGGFVGYPYQEYVWGLMHNPPIVSGQPDWGSVPVSFPSRSLFSSDSSVRWQNIPTPLPSHASGTCSLQVQPLTLNAIVAVAGTRSVDLVLTGPSEGSGWTAVATSSTDGDFAIWVLAIPNSGAAPPGEIEVRITPGAAGKTAGAYSGTIQITIDGVATIVPLNIVVAPKVFDVILPLIYGSG